MKTIRRSFGRLSLLMGLAGLLWLIAPKAQADEGDPPTRVARISYLDGSVSFEPNGDEQWSNAALNRPVTIGDKIWVDKDSKAELQAGEAAIHLDSMTSLSFLNLDQETTQMRLAEGTINFRVSELRQGDIYEVDAPNLAFNVKQAGAFRVDVDENGDATRVTVIRGEGEVTAGGKTYEVHAGQMAEFDGTDANLQYSVTQAPAPDGFDQWAQARDLKEDNSVSAKYVSRDTVGYSDLDDYGTWDEVPDYGPVWYPTTVSAGWAPYSNGYWNWVGPWGWTWVDYYPWGFAPFHYGRWSYIGSRWGWCPGPRYYRPIYGPAFVGFIGGAHWGVGFGVGGGVGWFPLGWGEPYRPWYRCGGAYIRNVNIYNTRIRNVNFNHFNNFNYRYARSVHAVTAASRENFVNGRGINRGAQHFTEASLRGGRVTNGTSFRPTRQSYTGFAGQRGRINTPPSRVEGRQVMARTAPARGAGHMPVHEMNTRGLTAGRLPAASSARGGHFDRPTIGRASTQQSVNNAGRIGRGAEPNSNRASNRQRELAADRPPSARGNVRTFSEGRGGNSAATQGGRSDRAPGRTWSAQGNATDRGRAPQGFGSGNRPGNARANGNAEATRMSRGDRPPWARGGQNGNAESRGGSFQGGSRGFEGRSAAPNARNDRPSFSNGNRGNSPNFRNDRPSFSNENRSNGRSYQSPQRSQDRPSMGGNRSYSSPRSYNPPQRSYPSRGYSAPQRSYSAPNRSYSAPSRSYSAPSRSFGGSRNNGGNSGGSRGGGSRGGGGGRHH